MLNNNVKSNNEIDYFLLNLSTGYLKSIALKIIIDLEIANKLIDGPKTCKELSEICKVDSNNLYSLMRSLSSIGIFKEDENQDSDQLFHNTDISKRLIENKMGGASQEDNNTILNVCKLQTGLLETFLHLDKTIRNGIPMGMTSIGYKNPWEYYEKNPIQSELFHKSMTFYTSKQINAILKSLSFNQFETIVDLGGSRGDFLKSIIESNENSKTKSFINFDLPEAIQSDTNKTSKDPRYKDVVGSFFDNNPLPIGNCYLLKAIFHLFQDDQSLIILDKISNSLIKDDDNNSVVYIFDHVLTKNKSTIPFHLEYQMMNNYGGKERSKEQWFKLIEQSKFQIDDIQPIAGITISAIKLKLKK